LLGDSLLEDLRAEQKMFSERIPPRVFYITCSFWRRRISSEPDLRFPLVKNVQQKVAERDLFWREIEFAC